MNAREALKLLEDKASIDGLFLCLSPAMEEAVKALREKVEREEKERPKVTLAEQIEAVAWCSRAHPSSQRNAGKPPIGVTLHHAAATLRRLEEEGPKFAGAGVIFQSELASWLKSLGVEARKP